VSGSYADAFTFRAWDRSVTTTGGVYKNTTTNGTSTEFSAATDTVSQYVVKPVTINTVSTDDVLNTAEALVISGTADNNATVALNVKGQTVNVVADASGNWNFDGSKVRYIMVRKDLENKAYAATGDIQVDAVWNIGDVRAMDGATNRSSSATVTYSANGTRSPNGSLIDGLDTTFVEILGSSYSAADRDVWVQLDLGASYALSSIDVLGRSGGDRAERLNGSVVYTSNQDMSAMTRAQLDAAFNINSSVVSLNNDGTVYTVTSPTSTNGLDLVAGSNTISGFFSI
jgi:hypothetical protein